MQTKILAATASVIISLTTLQGTQNQNTEFDDVIYDSGSAVTTSENEIMSLPTAPLPVTTYEVVNLTSRVGSKYSGYLTAFDPWGIKCVVE